MWIHEGKIQFQKKEIVFVWVTFLTSPPSFLCHPLLLSSSTPFPFPSDVLTQWLYGDVLCDDIMSKRLKIWKSLAIYYSIYYFRLCFSFSPNGHTTSNRCRFDVDIMSIRRRPNFDDFPRRFHVLFQCNFTDRKIHVVSTHFFRSNFDGGKIHVVSTYFFRCNFDGGKIHLVSTYFFPCNFFRRNIHSVFTYFFRRNFDGQIIHFVCKYFFRQNFDEFDVVVGKL